MRIRIDALAGGGRGVGRAGGKVWLVAGGLPGDLVDAEILGEHPRWVDAVAVARIEEGPDRRPAACPHQPACGGCAWMVLREEAQRDWKRRIVIDALERIARLRNVPVEPTVASPRDLGYRNKVELVFGRDRSGRRLLGYHAASGELVDIERCLLHDDGGQAIHHSIRSFFLEGEGRDEPALDDPRRPIRLIVRRSEAAGAYLVALRGAPGPFASATAFARAIRERHPTVAGVVRLTAEPGRRGGTRTEILDGAGTLPETIAGTRFEVPAATFAQVNAPAAERLALEVLEAAGTPERVLELYGGMGIFSLAIARERRSFGTVVEADADAVAAGRAAASAIGARVRFVRSAVGPFLETLGGEEAHDVIVADPPRTGMERGAARAAARIGAPRVVMVSCDPATLARDLVAFVEAGYAVARVVPFDLFPQTPHVEVVARLDRT